MTSPMKVLLVAAAVLTVASQASADPLTDTLKGLTGGLLDNLGRLNLGGLTGNTKADGAPTPTNVNIDLSHMPGRQQAGAHDLSSLQQQISQLAQMIQHLQMQQQQQYRMPQQMFGSGYGGFSDQHYIQQPFEQRQQQQFFQQQQQQQPGMPSTGNGQQIPNQSNQQ